jgi:hypothetical protein
VVSTKAQYPFIFSLIKRVNIFRFALLLSVLQREFVAGNMHKNIINLPLLKRFSDIATTPFERSTLKGSTLQRELVA